MAIELDLDTLNWAKFWDFQHVGETDPNTGVVLHAPQECERAILPGSAEEGEYSFDGTVMFLRPRDIIVRHVDAHGARDRYEGHTPESYEANFRRVQWPAGV